MEIIKDKYNKDIAVLGGDLISGWIKEQKELCHDKNSLPQILKYINKGDTVIDAGGFIADHSVAYAEIVGETGLVVIFEPNPIALEALKFNVRNLTNVRIYDNALSYCGDKNNYIIEYDDKNVGASYIRQKDKGTKFAVCIDNIPLERLDFIKADIEGYEYNMLLGAEQSIRKFKPIMVLEINKGALARNGHNEGMIFDLLNQWNYTYRNIYEGQKMEGEQYDIIAFPKSL